MGVAGKVLSIATFTLLGAAGGFYVVDRVRTAQKTETIVRLRSEAAALRAQVAAASAAGAGAAGASGASAVSAGGGANQQQHTCA